MSSPFLGEIRAFGFSFAPRGWFFCDGQLLQISQYSALFSILGTYYGGNGSTTFALPNLQGRSPMHWGTGPGLTARTLGEVLGESSVTLIAGQMPAHAHSIVGATAATGTSEATNTPASNTYLGPSNPGALYLNPISAPQPFSPKAMGFQGQSLPHDNMQPYQVLNYCIAWEGIFPSRN